jgi:P27 family predicted phage terminase small subunit
MPGRRPKPTALKELEGNPGKRPLNRSEPKPTGIPSCPKHLDKGARAEWKRISAELIKLGLLTSVDRAALAAYCAAYSRWAEAELSVQKYGAVIKSPKSGYPIQNPYVGIANTAMDQMRKFMVEFGLTPASRSRLQMTPDAPPGQDAFESFMQSIGATDLDLDDATAHLQSEGT